MSNNKTNNRIFKMNCMKNKTNNKFKIRNISP